MTDDPVKLISATWMAPVMPNSGLLTDHTLIVEGERILALLPRADALTQYPKAPETRLEGHLLTPGFINVHCHAAMTLMRGVADDRDMMDWLTNWIWPLESQLVDEQFVYDGTRLAALEMLLGGTTCVADSYFFPDASSRAFSDMHLRAQVGMMVMQFSNVWARDEEEHIHKGLALRDSIKDHPLLTTAFAPHAPYSVTDQGFERVRLFSEKLDMPVHLHLHETATEIEDAVRESGMRPMQRMQKLGMLSPALQAVHATQLREDEIELLAVNDVQIAHCPESNMKLASGVCPVNRLHQAGVNFALGTDGAASNNDLDMIQEARSASMLASVSSGDAASLSAEHWLATMTIKAARFLGLADQIGSLEPGKLADVAAIDLSGPSFQPVFNPVSQLIFTATARDVSAVWVSGRQLVRDGKAHEADAGAILRATANWQNQVQKIIGKQKS